ncbi:serine/threonine protein kinase [bacterium]|nr:serine/threonine protein kinase [bacterium]
MPKPKLKGYELLDAIGNGAGSIVYKAIDRRTNEMVAIKHVTPGTIQAIEKARRRGRTGDERLGAHARINYKGFYHQVANEYRVLRNLDESPHIVKVHELVTLRRFFRLQGYDLIMEYIKGVSFRDKRDYPMLDILRFYREAASALAFLHAHRILHADMKPHHIFITADGHVKILDFGQARFFSDPPGRVQGTVDFMAPEQAKGRPVDVRTDVYGLGATFYSVLTGENNRPALSGMGGGVGFTVGYAGRAKSVRDINPDCPPALEDLILRSCERRPEKRPPSMNEIVGRLDILLGSIGQSTG